MNMVVGLSVTALIFLIVLAAAGFPVRPVFRFACGIACGFVLLAAYNLAGEYFGMSVGLNLANAVTIAVLGLPGFATILTLQWLLA